MAVAVLAGGGAAAADGGAAAAAADAGGADAGAEAPGVVGEDVVLGHSTPHAAGHTPRGRCDEVEPYRPAWYDGQNREEQTQQLQTLRESATNRRLISVI